MKLFQLGNLLQVTKYNHTAPAPILASLPTPKARHRSHPDLRYRTPQWQHLPQTIPGQGIAVYKLRGRMGDQKQNTMSCGGKILVLWSARHSVSLPPRITPHRSSRSVAQPDEGPGSTPSPRSTPSLALPLHLGAYCHGKGWQG